MLGFTLVFYFRALLRVLGSFAIAAEVLFVLAIGLGSYFLGFGLKQAQRSAMALAMCTRNASGHVRGFHGLPGPGPCACS